MAIYTGKDASVTVGGNALSSVESITIDEQAEIFTAIPLGATSATQDVGIATGSGSITYFVDPADSSGQGSLSIGASVSVILYGRGSSNTASPTRSFTAIVSSISHNNARDFVRETANFVVSGDVTKA